MLEGKSSSADQARRRADALKVRANKLAAETFAKLELLKGDSNLFAIPLLPYVISIVLCIHILLGEIYLQFHYCLTSYP